MKTALVIGAGPAGLMAAEQLAHAGLMVTVADQMPSVGRKFLMAGKSGLNLTMDEPVPDFVAHYGVLSPALAKSLTGFGPAEVVEWAKALGQPVFTGSTGRVFPTAMKASPLLRAWLRRLGGAGVVFRNRWRFNGWVDDVAQFDTPDGVQAFAADVTVLAMGGASWRRLGSDGAWAQHISPVTPFAPANMGFLVQWSTHMQSYFGTPVKGTQLFAGGQTTRGEWVISQNGIEGGGVYTLSRAMRMGGSLSVDLCPDTPIDKLRAALARPKGKATLSNHLRKVAKLDGVRLALVNEFGRPFGPDLAEVIKALPIRHAGPQDMDSAISTAGGVRFDGLTDTLMLRNRAGVFCAGEMLDWEAPTGGYLITGCLATGRQAGQAAADFAKTA